MHVRTFDSIVDNAEALAKLSPFSSSVQRNLATQYALRTLIPENILLLEDAGEVIGIAHLFDGGLPWAVVDGVYITPERRSVEAALVLLKGIDEALQHRGLSFFTLHADKQLADILTSRYSFVATGDSQYTLLVKSL